MREPHPLKQDLRKPPLFRQGFFRAAYPVKRMNLRAEATKHIVKQGFINRPVPLEELHLHVRKEDQLAQRVPLNAVVLSILEPPSGYMKAYHRLLKYMAQEIFKFDFVFEQIPVTRFHFPVRYSDQYRTKEGNLMLHHSDMFIGDVSDQINCWLPLTKCYGTNSLQLASLPDSIKILHRFCRDFDYHLSTFRNSRELFFQKSVSDLDFQATVVQSCSPLNAEFGEVYFFDPRIIHGAAENVEKHTRVSLDFRLLPLDRYEAMIRHHQNTGQKVPEHLGRPLIKGAFYDERSALEL